jgi:hypothetical protein
VLDLLKDGYVLPFEKRLPEKYEEDNNGSARNNMKFVRETVRKWEAKGIVQFVVEKPLFISPLTVAERQLSSGEIKRRLCWDGSRCINLALKKDKVTLAHLHMALEQTEENDLQCKYDLQSAYYHVKIFEPHWKYLGAKFIDEDGRSVYFVFKYMPFGLATAVHCITKLFKPIGAYFGAQGIRHSIFIDDGRVLAKSVEESKQQFSTVLSVLKKAGWLIEKTKTDTLEGGNKVKEYLGFKINTESMSVNLTEEKAASLRENLTEMISTKGRWVTVKMLAKTLGKMISAEPALGTFPLIMARRAYSDLDGVVSTKGWKATIKLSKEVLEDLQTFLSQFQEHDGSPIRSASTAVSVISIIGPPSEFLKVRTIPNHVKNCSHDIWCGDASDVAVCAYSIKSEKEIYFVSKLKPEEMLLSSGHRELLTVKYALEKQLEVEGPWAKTTSLYWITDSQNLVVFLTKGSRKLHIQVLLLQVLKLARRLNIVLVPIHLLRDDPRIQIADAGSKIPDSDDWSVDSENFSRIEEQFGPFTIDLFADQSNHKTDRFYANFLCPSSLGVDAFCHTWDNEVAWICPPVNCIIPTIRKIILTTGEGVLIVPKWPTARFWPVLCPDGATPIFPFKDVYEFRPNIVQNSRARSPLSGCPPFSFLAIYFNSKN